MKCIICKTELKNLELGGQTTNQFDGGGDVLIYCHFGSIHDQGHGTRLRAKPFKAAICDRCITDNLPLIDTQEECPEGHDCVPEETE